MSIYIMDCLFYYMNQYGTFKKLAKVIYFTNLNIKVKCVGHTQERDCYIYKRINVQIVFPDNGKDIGKPLVFLKMSEVLEQSIKQFHKADLSYPSTRFKVPMVTNWENIHSIKGLFL